MPSIRFFRNILSTQFVRHYAVNTPKPSNILSKIFKKFIETERLSPTQARKSQLVEIILRKQVTDSEEAPHKPSEIENWMKAIPKELPLSTRIGRVKHRLTQYPAMPVITAHPTMVFSPLALALIHHITVKCLQLGDQDTPKDDTVEIERQIYKNIHELVYHSMLPTTNLSPKEESERASFIYKKILESYPNFLRDIAKRFVKIHGGDLDKVIQEFRKPVMLSFQNISSWVMGDADGNNEVKRETMAKAVPAQQKAILEMYDHFLQETITLLTQEGESDYGKILQKRLEYFHRCITAIDGEIFFNVTGSEKIKEKFYQLLEKASHDPNVPPHIVEKINHLADLVQLAGLAGGLKEFVRQSTYVNSAVLDNFFEILSRHKTEIRELMRKDNVVRTYQELNDKEKKELHTLLRSHPDYFKTLKQNKGSFTETTNRELERLYFILKNKEIFSSYICSDTQSALNFEDLRILFRFSSYLHGQLYIEEIREHPVLTLPLCETPKDIHAIETIVRIMLDDPHMRKRIVETGYFSYVGGPSDLGKTGGIATHLSLLLAQMRIEDLFKEYKKYPELSGVRLVVLHGYGGDYKRRIGAARQRHATFQGADAYHQLAAPNAYAHFLDRVIGHPPEADFKVRELRDLKQENPEAFEKLLMVEKELIQFFEKFIQDPNTKALLNALTFHELETRSNTSSRAGSKKGTAKKDASASRAIGVLNHYMLAGISDIFMGLGGLVSLESKYKKELPLFFSKLTVIQDIVYKTYYAIATTDFQRARLKLQKNAPELLPILRYQEKMAIKILESMTVFLPKAQRKEAKTYLAAQKFTSHQTMALSLLDFLGGHFHILAKEIREALPHYERLSQLINEYVKNPTPATAENVVLALRGVRILEGPKILADLMSPLHRKHIDGVSVTSGKAEAPHKSAFFNGHPVDPLESVKCRVGV